VRPAPADEVTLSDDDMRLAVAAGGTRHLHALLSGRRDSHGFSGDTWGAHIEGAAGELAVARSLGWSAWTPTVDTYQSEPDLPLRIEVTTRSRHDWDLIVRPRMALERNHVLVTGVAPTFRVRGWIPSQIARRPEWWAAHGGRPGAWFVPAAELYPMPLLALYEEAMA
jgi:hypothetical protein